MELVISRVTGQYDVTVAMLCLYLAPPPVANSVWIVTSEER